MLVCARMLPVPASLIEPVAIPLLARDSVVVESAESSTSVEVTWSVQQSGHDLVLDQVLPIAFWRLGTEAVYPLWT